MPPRIDQSRCDGCGVCVEVCPGDILHLDRGIGELVRYGDECSHCDVCRIECPSQAIEIEFPWHMRQRPVSLRLGDPRPDDPERPDGRGRDDRG